MAGKAHSEAVSPVPHTDLQRYLMEMADELYHLALMAGQPSAAALFSIVASEIQSSTKG